MRRHASCTVLLWHLQFDMACDSCADNGENYTEIREIKEFFYYTKPKYNDIELAN